VTLTEGPPASGPEGLRRVLTPAGRFAGLARLSAECLRGTIPTARFTSEIIAQAERVQRAGFRLGHIDAHEHVQHLPCVRAAVAQAARRLGIAWVRVADEAVSYEFSTWQGTAKKLALLPFVASARRFYRSCGLRSADRFFGVALARPQRFDAALSAAIRRARVGVNEICLHIGAPGDEQADRMGAFRSNNLQSLLRYDLRAAAAREQLVLTNFAGTAMAGRGEELGR